MRATWRSRPLRWLLATFIIITAGCTEEPAAPTALGAPGEPATIQVPAEPGCPIHAYEEETDDDDCCGCHFFSLLDCEATCDEPEPVPEPAGTVLVGAGTGVAEHHVTYYRIGGGAEPKDDEYEFLEGQSGENGKIRKNGGDSNKGVSFFTTQADAEKARDRIPGATAKIHKVSRYDKDDLTFVGSMPPANHVHCVPNREMTLKEFKAALKKVKLTKVE